MLDISDSPYGIRYKYVKSLVFSYDKEFLFHLRIMNSILLWDVQ